MPELITTPTGLRILVEPLPHTYSVSIGCFVHAGSRHEPDAHAGAAHFIEHMCFKGSHAFPTARQISEAVEGVGGILNASTSYESTVYWAKVATIHFDRALAVLADMLTRPIFDPRELEKERRVIIEEIRGIQDSPSDLIHEILHQVMWGEQSLGRDIAGSVETVAALSRTDLLDFFQRHYNRDTMVISVAGNITVDQVVEAVDRAFSDLPRATALNPLIPPQACRGPQVKLIGRDIEQGNFCLGVPGLSYNDADRRALQVLDSVLGGGMSSRLFQVLREENGMAYSVGSYHTELSDTGMWVIYGSVEPESLRDGLVLCRDMLADLVQHGVTTEELAMVKEQVKGGILLSLEDTWSVASRNGAHMLRYGHVIPVEQVVAEVETVTAEQIQHVAQRLLLPEALHLAVLGPYDGDDEQELVALVQGLA
ncbi:peptidase M16 domain protein [Oscillochloris trichoides DG-6]|uniref:Peptidase M16 domain protein n=1 Tax=Oscillochloris trichoides DG-6 TaxID=765420 RepID=E1IG52_9CHLR|nr:pitrilysin family protein [Oscillochloris trichoides]EFO79832.1 peptidase M16 domain protein [Oscillochloris trichoides DG-6]